MVQELSGVQLRVSWYIFLQYLSEQQQVSKTVPNNLPLLSVLGGRCHFFISFIIELKRI
jgi:hypothetical protein